MKSRELTEREVELLATFYVKQMHEFATSDSIEEIDGEYVGLLSEMLGINYTEDDKIEHYLKQKEDIRNSISFAIDLSVGDVYIKLNYFKQIDLEKQSYYEKGSDEFIIDKDGLVELVNNMEIIKK